MATHKPLALELEHVTVRYGAVAAVEDLTLALAPGEILGFLGPNGAGKTSTLRAIAGLLRAPATLTGTIRLLGSDLRSPGSLAVWRRIGFVPDPDGLDPRLRADQALAELAALSGVPPVDRAALCAALELRPTDLRRRIGRLSRGTRQKVALVQGLQHRPDLLILDEPGEGLDPLAKQSLNQLLLAARERGAAILFSSHILSDVEAVCDRVALIRAGRLVGVEALDDLRRRLALRVVVRLRDGAVLPAIPGIEQLQAAGAGWQFRWAGEADVLLRWLADLPVAEIEISPPALADVFTALYRKESA